MKLGGTGFIRNIKDCVSAFLPLLNTEYKIVLGRKEVAVTLRITFDKKDCFHLMGLQYLVDRPELNRDRGKVFLQVILSERGKRLYQESGFMDPVI